MGAASGVNNSNKHSELVPSFTNNLPVILFARNSCQEPSYFTHGRAVTSENVRINTSKIMLCFCWSLVPRIYMANNSEAKCPARRAASGHNTVMVERGWRAWEGGDYEDLGSSWHVWWRHGFHSATYRRLRPYQVLNHIPRAFNLCKKDSLARSLQKMKRVFGSIFDFFPHTYLLPGEYTKLVAEYTRLLYQGTKNGLSKKNETNWVTQINKGNQIEEEVFNQNIWIVKPIGSSQGRGISIFQDLHDLTYASSAVVQRYIGNPLLIGGYKCDVRLYVLITSFQPLTVYVYREGIVRFSTEKYNLSSLDNVFSHLTNTSLNKTAPGYKMEKERVGAGVDLDTNQYHKYFGPKGQKMWLLSHRLLSSRLSFASFLTSTMHQSSYETTGFPKLRDNKIAEQKSEINELRNLRRYNDNNRVFNLKQSLLRIRDHNGADKMTYTVVKINFSGSVFRLFVLELRRPKKKSKIVFLMTFDGL
ncbi:unnamed protein product, partial [Meganyctiphanes norvegica]